MNILELFAGSRSIGSVADKLGHNVFSVDIKSFNGIDLVKDIEHLQPSDIPFIPDMIWASPLCTTFSLAAISHHRDGQRPVSDLAIKSDMVIQNTLKIIKSFPKAKWFIENPRGMLQEMWYMDGLEKVTVWYCRYGDKRAKPTHIWSNHIKSLFNPVGWQPRPQCWNGNRNCHHESAPRGSKTGTQGLKNDYERSKIPEELCEEIIKSVEV
jgi:hypothetical protein